ncbi:filamentation induced by cAMP protein fic, partial [Lactobacillus sp. XV13L]|nr:filamentation induced by cAMP protein fic [Lactobacillus sp. XV13L]
YIRQNFVNLVHTTSRFEGINTTLPQTQTIIDGLGVDGVPIDQINTIVDLKRGWQFITEKNITEDITLDFEKEINRIVAAKDALIPGELRTGEGGVNVGSNDYFIPPKVSDKKEKLFLNDLLNSDRSTTDKALTLMYHNMRNQIFWDGNKRTATIAANKVMMNGGAGIINIPLNKWGEWNKLITKYYKSNDMNHLKEWTYNHGIQGIDTKTLERAKYLQRKHDLE